MAESSSSLRGDGNEAGGFECNICIDLARDPVITLCGHLYCWPCLYTWLRGHSWAHECPVCKAVVAEDKVVPLYGRGKPRVDPRSKPIPGVEIPNRPAGQRPEPARPVEDTNLANVLLGLMGGFLPLASATFANVGTSAGFGGVFTPFFNVQLHGFSNPVNYGGLGYHTGYGHPSRNREGRRASADDRNLTKILLIIIVLVILTFLTM
ncbi:uncharacterized protein LOC127244112 [Andrographis paniculata]|uniref:uncharacterized protein LOC127244112 n=1 Tax=Andrographis paniculata TaxID=175694 RepID=UPI0021E8D9F9|nr:uncharacterized protein LOC127244112 [Andrographis paniculata]